MKKNSKFSLKSVTRVRMVFEQRGEHEPHWADTQFKLQTLDHQQEGL